jgi:hypothetical protein
MRPGAKTRKTMACALNEGKSPGSSGVSGATVTPRDQSVMRGWLMSPVEW